jgi:hypothetical protein
MVLAMDIVVDTIVITIIVGLVGVNQAIVAKNVVFMIVGAM